MIFKHFRIGVIWRVVLLSICLALWMYLLFQTSYYITLTILAGVIIGLVVHLIRYVEQTNAKLSRFLNSIRYSDFSRAFPDHGLGASFEELNDAFNRVIDEFKKERAEKHQNYRYLQTVVQHIGVGLISFNHHGEIELINTAAKRLFDVPTLRNVSALKKISAPLFNTVTELEGGNRTLTQISVNDETLQLSISATEFRMHDEHYKLVSFQNIHTELEEKEMEAWQNLTQVLAHEIMNSITPIASLSETVRMLLNQRAMHNDEEYHIDSESLDDVKEALETINNRSHGLMRFVNSYRDFTQIPDPEFELFRVDDMLRRIKNLNKGEAESQDITVNIRTDPETLEITADPDLIEQVLINLTKNAFRALEDTADATVTLTGRFDSEGRPIIEVSDNGPGIKEENQQKIFIPFYSTSQPTSRGGSGIGLSLSRQIMRKHRGALTVTSDEDSGTTFTLRF